MACLITSDFTTGLPSSEKPTQPACASSAISLSPSPSRFLVMLPTGRTFTNPTSLLFRRTYSATIPSSTTGSVLGMLHTAVNPPAAAAFDPVMISSLYSYPGSLKWTWISMNPGQTIFPSASTISSFPSGDSSFPIAAILPSITRTSAISSILFAGSMTRPPLTSNLIFSTSKHQVKNCHPYCDSVCYLFVYDTS